MKIKKVLLVLVLAAPILGIGVWYFAMWSIRGAFDSVADRNFEPISGALEAVIGSTIARGSLQMPAVKSIRPGAIPFYVQAPAAMQEDKKFFLTWHSALFIADSTVRQGYHSGQWQDSSQLLWIPPPQRHDAWGHDFCVYSDDQKSVVISAGPQALSALDCGTVRVSDFELAKMRNARLVPKPSGAVIMVTKKYASASK
jgi:hypothetical protein